MKNAIVLQHVEFEGPARLAQLVTDHGYNVETRLLHRGDAVPARVKRDDLLIVMGGPMGIGDVDRPDFPFLADEVRLLRQRIADDAPTFGVCLGAQLLAHAAGARVYPMTDAAGSRTYEVGWSAVHLRGPEGDDLVGDLPPQAEVLHWHGDTFDLPAAATLFASSEACKHQGFRLGRRIFGLQFHCEADVEQVERFLHADADFVVRANGPDGVAALRAQTARVLEKSRPAADRLLRTLVRAMTSP